MFRVMTLKELRDTRVDMFTTVYIGNSQTKMLNGKMVTPRGYIFMSTPEDWTKQRWSSRSKSSRSRWS